MVADPGLGLKLMHLRLVAAIVQRGQLQRAAEDLGMSQPAASRMLSEVERLVGAPLFIRHPKGMELTAMGRMIARRAQVVAAEMQDLSREVRGLRRGLSGLVRVGSVTGPAVGYLVPAIRRLRDMAPEVEIRVDVGPSTVLMPALAAGELDFVIGRVVPDADPEEVLIQPGRRETISVLARKGHPLEERGPVGIADLANCDWIIQERGTPIRTAIEEAMTNAGLRLPQGIVSTSSLLVMIALLSESDAISPTGQEVTTLLVNEPVSAGFTVLPLREPLELPFYHIISPRGRSQLPAVERLRELVLEEMAK